MAIPVAERHLGYLRTVAARPGAADVRVEVDASDDRVQRKIRDAQLQKAPFMIIAGDEDESAGAVSFRYRDAGTTAYRSTRRSPWSATPSSGRRRSDRTAGPRPAAFLHGRPVYPRWSTTGEAGAGNSARRPRIRRRTKGRTQVNVTRWWRSNVPDDTEGRRFVFGSLINNLGSGVQETVFPFFLILVAHIPATETGLAFLIAGAVGLASPPFAGRLCDRLGPRGVVVVGYSCQAAVSCGLVFIHSLWTLCLLLSIARAAAQVSRVGRLSMVAGVRPERRNTLRAQMSVCSNVGVAAGMGLSAVVLSIGTRDAYLAGFLLDALTFVVATVVQWSVTMATAAAPPTTRKGRSWSVLFTDRRFASVTALNGFLCFHQVVLFLGVPLWIASTGAVPRPVTTAIAVINMAMTILLQVRFSAPVRGVRDAARAWRRAASGIVVACGLILLVRQLDSTVLRIGTVAVAVVFFTLGELWYSAAEMEVSTALAPEGRVGTYQGLFLLGRDGATTGGPLLAAFLCVSLGSGGWLLLAGLYAVFGLVGPAVLARADRTAVGAPLLEGSA